jgi:pimeloyl-ACP methyl ester carboxylesterase
VSTDPTFVLELPEGRLGVHDLSGGPVLDDVPTVLLVHGITANGLSFQRVAEELVDRYGPGRLRILAPDLRGRASSAGAPGPYGLAAHVEDLLTVGDAFATRPVLVGHSMGAYVAALAGGRHPDRFRGLVLVDGGLAFPAPADLDLDAALQTVLGPAMQRLSMRFDSPQAYLDFWDAHPALGPVLRGRAGDAARRYILHDLVPAVDGDRWRSSCVLDAVRADGADVLVDAETHAGARRAVEQGLPVELVWAHRGLQAEPQGLFDEARLAALDLPERLRTTGVDANHYDVILAEPGVTAVADAVDRVLAAS